MSGLLPLLRMIVVGTRTVLTGVMLEDTYSTFCRVRNEVMRRMIRWLDSCFRSCPFRIRMIPLSENRS